MRRFRRRRTAYVWTANFSQNAVFDVSGPAAFEIGRTTETGSTTTEPSGVGKKMTCRRVVGQFFIRQAAVVAVDELATLSARLYKFRELTGTEYQPNHFLAADAVEGHGSLMWQRYWRWHLVTTFGAAIDQEYPQVDRRTTFVRGDQLDFSIDWRGVQPVYENERLILEFSISAATGAEEFMQASVFIRGLWSGV